MMLLQAHQGFQANLTYPQQVQEIALFAIYCEMSHMCLAVTVQQGLQDYTAGPDSHMLGLFKPAQLD